MGKIHRNLFPDGIRSDIGGQHIQQMAHPGRAFDGQILFRQHGIDPIAGMGILPHGFGGFFQIEVTGAAGHHDLRPVIHVFGNGEIYGGQGQCEKFRTGFGGTGAAAGPVLEFGEGDAHGVHHGAGGHVVLAGRACQ
jgi:hypothetical protein